MAALGMFIGRLGVRSGRSPDRSPQCPSAAHADERSSPSGPTDWVLPKPDSHPLGVKISPKSGPRFEPVASPRRRRLLGGGVSRLLLSPALLARRIPPTAFFCGEEQPHALHRLRVRWAFCSEDRLEQCAARHSRGSSPSRLASMCDVQAECGTGFERCLTARGVTAFLTREWLGQDRKVVTLGIVQRDGGHRFIGHGEPRAANVARASAAAQASARGIGRIVALTMRLRRMVWLAV
jgi:hypothetical protein